MSTANRTAGERVREERKKRGWTQLRLLVEAGLPMQITQLSKLEQGKAVWPLDRLELIADTLGVPVDSLLRHEA